MAHRRPKTWWKNRLVLRKWDLALVETIRSLDFPQAGDEPEEDLWRSCDDERLGPIVERNKQLGDWWKVLVCLGDMGFEFLEAQAGDGQHATWCSLTALENRGRLARWRAQRRWRALPVDLWGRNKIAISRLCASCRQILQKLLRRQWQQQKRCIESALLHQLCGCKARQV